MSSQEKALEDVLYSFSAEPSHDEETLKRYVEMYPEYAEDLLDVLHEFRFTEALSYVETEAVLDTGSQEAWNKFISCHPSRETVSEVETFGEKLRGQAFVGLATAMSVPRAFLVAFRDRLVIPSTIPKSFVTRLAEAAKVSLHTVQGYLALPPQLAGEAQFKSDDKPQQQGQITFQELVEKTSMPEEDRIALLKDSGANGPQ